jgi:hypothetical protein
VGEWKINGRFTGDGAVGFLQNAKGYADSIRRQFEGNVHGSGWNKPESTNSLSLFHKVQIGKIKKN